MKHYSNFSNFEIASLDNVPGHYLRKYEVLRSLLTGSWKKINQNIVKSNVWFVTMSLKYKMLRGFTKFARESVPLN